MESNHDGWGGGGECFIVFDSLYTSGCTSHRVMAAWQPGGSWRLQISCEVYLVTN
jgi:hypothetical protein